MGQQTSRPSIGQAGTRPNSSPLSPSHAWPRWASSLTQGLPPEGDRGLFRGEFILVQTPYTDTIGRSQESQPRVSHLFRHQFRSHPIALPETSSSDSMSQAQHHGITRLYDHYHNRSMVADAGPAHLTVPQRRGFTKSLTQRLGHITEEEEDATPDDIRHRDRRDKDASRIRDSHEKFHASRSAHRDKDGDDATDDDYNEDDDEDASSDDDYSHRKRSRSAQTEDGVPYHYFANHLVKPFFVTSQRYGSFQTMTARYKSSFPLPRPNVRISKSLPRPTKHIDYSKPSRRGVTLTWRNRFAKSENIHSFEGPYLKHELNGRSGETTIYSQSPRSMKASEMMPEYDLCHDYSEVHSPTVKSYEGRRPLSPVQDYSSSESGISDDYRTVSKTGKKSSSRNSGTIKTSSSDESNRLYKRRKSSSADSAMRDFDLLSSCSSGDDDNNANDVFNSGSGYKSHGSPRSSGSAAMESPRRVSDSSSNSNSSGGVKARQSLDRRSGKDRRSQTEDRRAGNVSHRKNTEDIDTRVLQQDKVHRANKIPNAENTWPQLKSCLANDDDRELETVASLHNDSFLGANETRRRSMPYRDVSLDSDYGDLNRTGKSSRSASHKSVAFADDTLDTSLADYSSKNLSKSLADIINTSLTDGTYSTRKTINRSKSSPADPDHELPPNKSSTQDTTDKVQESNNSVPSVLHKSTALHKSGRSYSSDSFLSSPNCTDKIKRLQDILIKQALPFARPDNLLSTQPKKINKTDISLDNTDDMQSPEDHATENLNTQITELLNTSTQITDTLNTPKQITDKLNTSTQITEKLNTSTEITEKLNTSKQVTDKLNTSTQVKQKLNTPKQITDKLNTSTQITDKLNMSTQITEKLNTSSQKIQKLNTPKQITEKLNTSSQIKQKSNTSKQITEKLNTPTQITEKSQAKQHAHSQSEGDLPVNKQTVKQRTSTQSTKLRSSDKDTSSVTNAGRNMSGSEPTSSLSQKPEQSSTIPPPPPPPPAPPLPAFLNKTTSGDSSNKLEAGKSKPNISIIKVNQKTSAKSKAVHDSQKTASKSMKS